MVNGSVNSTARYTMHMKIADKSAKKGYDSIEKKPQISFEERYKKLNKAQKKAVDTIEGPLLVVAGPGSGKTEILSLRVAKILQETHATPSNILCLTFTDSAAVNMRERLSKLIGREAYRVSVHTFHSFTVDIIQKYPEFFYKGAIFSPADSISQIGILESIFDELPFKDPLRSVHPEEGFVFLKDVQTTIGYLKKAGVTPGALRNILEKNEKSILKINELLLPLIEKRVNNSVLVELGHAGSALLELATKDPEFHNGYIGEFPSLQRVVATTLLEAIDTAQKIEKNEPVSKWKAKWFKNTDEGTKTCKDTLYLEKMHSLLRIYEKYREYMHAKCLFDFDDMILDVIEAIQKHPRLKFDLQEQYQYILVDEFQDTNNAQMKILALILDAEVHEGRPNVMVVGDDDQAVYKFQGAELSNILNFKEMYKDVAVVNMVENYRSTQEILDVATAIIRKGEHRLENILPAFEKSLIASNKSLEKGGIVHKVFDTSLHEAHYVSRRIKALIDSGIPPEEIAVIARKHKYLEALVPFLQGAHVPIKYEREQNVFLEPHIEQLIVMSRFIHSLASKEVAEADEFLPKILAFPFFNISRITIWNISNTAYTERRTWLSVMQDDPSTKALAEFFIELGVRAHAEPLEKILDILIGAHIELLRESEEDELEEEENNLVNSAKKTGHDPYQIAGYTSEFKKHYFSPEKFEHARAEYLSFLSSLRVFVRALREYKGKSGTIEQLYIKDLVEFVDIHQKNNIALNDLSPFANASSAVSLLSAHKAKGLEFNTVFVLSCQDEVWAGRGMPKKIVLPGNMPIEPAGDTEDDQLRLFYVALTRAKSNLYLTSYKIKDDGRESQKIRFLTEFEETEAPMEEEFSKVYTPETHELLTASWLLYHTPPFVGEEEQLLKSLLEEYQLSVTHLNNFLNVTKGGPQTFLEQNLLRFPQAKTPSSAYGTAMHATLERISVKLRFDGILATKEECIFWFQEYLRRERLSKQDFDKFSERGSDALAVFYEQKISTFKATDKTEVNFKDQGVVLEGIVKNQEVEAHLTGKIDRLIALSGGRVEVIDYKTGKPKNEWQASTEYEKIKLYEYRRQLMFYNLLLEHAREYRNVLVYEKGILQFIEPMKNGTIAELSLSPDKELKDRTEKLALIVFNKIKNLDFPKVDEYSKDLEGIKAFEEDLLAGKL